MELSGHRGFRDSESDRAGLLHRADRPAGPRRDRYLERRSGRRVRLQLQTVHLPAQLSSETGTGQGSRRPGRRNAKRFGEAADSGRTGRQARRSRAPARRAGRGGRRADGLNADGHFGRAERAPAVRRQFGHARQHRRERDDTAERPDLWPSACASATV